MPHVFYLEIFTFSQFYEKNGHLRKSNPKCINNIESILVLGDLKWNGGILESAKNSLFCFASFHTGSVCSLRWGNLGQNSEAKKHSFDASILLCPGFLIFLEGEN